MINVLKLYLAKPYLAVLKKAQAPFRSNMILRILRFYVLFNVVLFVTEYLKTTQIHKFNNYLFSNSYTPGTVLSAWETFVNKSRQKIEALVS